MPTPTVMIFDDDQDLLEICQMILSGMKLQVICRDNCRNVITDIEASSPQLVLMDNRIGPKGGVTAIRQIKENYPSIPAIFLSGDANIQELALEAGADAYLSKPFDVDKLEKLVSDWLGKLKSPHQ